MQRILLPVLLVVVCARFVSAQTATNPDISVIGDLRGFTHDDANRPAEDEEFNLAPVAMELYATGYLNPYARASATVGWHEGENAEIEEVYADILRGLPLKASLRAGKYLLDFGRLNPVHEHAWSFIKRPLPHELFFGEEGLNDVGVRASFLLPTGDAFTELSGAVLKGDALLGHGHEHGEEAEEEHGEGESESELGFFGRLTTSLAVSEFSELALGVSAVNSVGAFVEPELTPSPEPEELRTWLAGFDVKYRHVPSRFTTLQIEAEGILRSDETEEGDRLDSYGGYAYLDYRFRQRYNIGGIFEYVTLKEHEHDELLGEDITHEMDIWRAGLFAGFAPVEETAIVRLAGHWTEPDESDGFWELTLQLVFSLGPHQPHNF